MKFSSLCGNLVVVIWIYVCIFLVFFVGIRGYIEFRVGGRRFGCFGDLLGVCSFGFVLLEGLRMF